MSTMGAETPEEWDAILGRKKTFHVKDYPSREAQWAAAWKWVRSVPAPRR